jgi:hypothetical protein
MVRASDHWRRKLGIADNAVEFGVDRNTLQLGVDNGTRGPYP